MESTRQKIIKQCLELDIINELPNCETDGFYDNLSDGKLKALHLEYFGEESLKEVKNGI